MKKHVHHLQHLQHSQIFHKKNTLKISQGNCEKNNNTPLPNSCEENNNQMPYSGCDNIHMRIRLNRAIAATGFCSRRKADDLIDKGRVKINGVPVNKKSIFVTLSDQIEIDNVPLVRPTENIYIMINKPVGVVCTLSDPQHRKTVLDILPDRYKKGRIFPVGRLDFFSEGLLILTNDGELAHKMMHPSMHMTKNYEVIIRDRIDMEKIRQMEKGMLLEDGTRLAPVEATVRYSRDGNTILHLTLYQGINRQIRRMCALLDLVILRLRRIAQGPLRLGNLSSGEARPLKKEELEALEGFLGSKSAIKAKEA